MEPVVPDDDDGAVERLSQVLTSLEDLNVEGEDHRHQVRGQVEILRQVQEQMNAQLTAHDAQIATLREVIALLQNKAGR